MKIFLEFDPIDDKEDLYYAQNGIQYALVLEDIDTELRNTVKYGNSVLPGKNAASKLEIEIAQHIRSRILELMKERDLKQ